MLTQAELRQLRDVAESAMVDTCTVVRPNSDRGELDPVTLRYPEGTPTPVYAGKCEVERPGGGTPTETSIAGGERVTYDVTVKLPAGDAQAVQVRRGDVVRVDATAHTPALVGRAFTVRAIADSTWSTKRRLLCVEGV